VTHAAYVTAAYLVSALALVGLMVWILVDQRSQKRALEDLEKRGVRRRAGSREAS
jgi:heme exporter protein CcmD